MSLCGCRRAFDCLLVCLGVCVLISVRVFVRFCLSGWLVARVGGCLLCFVVACIPLVPGVCVCLFV